MIFVFFYNVKKCECVYFFFSSRRRHTRFKCDWSSDVCSSDLMSGRPVSGCPGHVTLCEGGELFPTRQAIEAPRLSQQCVEPAGAHVAGFPRARTSRCEGGGQTVPVALGSREARAQDALLEQTTPQLP